MAVAGRKSGSSEQRNPVESPDSLHSKAEVRILLALGEGPWPDIPASELPKRVLLDGTPIQNQDGTFNMEGVKLDFRPGTEDQTYIPGVPGVESETGVGVELKYGEGAAWVRQISNTQIDAVRIRIGLARLVQQLDNGDRVGAVVDYRIDLAVGGGSYSTVVNGKFEGKTTTLYERDHRIDLPASSTGWRVRVVRLTPDSTTDMLVSQTQIQAITEIVDVKLTYPHTVLLFASFDAKLFSNIPPISLLSEGREVQIPTNYDPVAKTYSGTWNGEFKRAWTDNPAWVMFDAVTNERFSIGDKIPAFLMDKWQLYRIAQRCDDRIPDGAGGTEVRYKCDIYVQSRVQAWTLIRDLCAIFCGMSYWGNQMLNFISDSPSDAVQVLTNASVVNGQFVYKGGSVKNRRSVGMVSYDDPVNHYQSNVAVVPVQEMVQRYGYDQALELSGIGCTRLSEAQRKARYGVLTNAMDEQVSFVIGMEGIEFMPCDVVAIADAEFSGAQMGGRVERDSTGRTIYLDRAISDVVAIGDTIINRAIGQKEAERRTIAAIASDRRSVTVSADIPTGIAAFTPWVIDSANLAVRMFRITSVKWNEADNTFSCSGLIYNADKYDAVDSGARLDDRPVSLIPSAIVPAPTNLAMEPYYVMNQGVRTVSISFTWDRVDKASHYEMQWRRDNNDWINVPRQTTMIYDLNGVFSGDYQFRVRAISNVGEISSGWATSGVETIEGRAGDVPAIPLFTTTALVFGVRLDWSFPNDAEDTNKTEIRYSLNADGTDAMHLSDVAYPGTTYSQMGLSVGQRFYYSARLVDRQGNIGPWTAWTVGESSTDVSDISDAIFQDIQKTDGWKDLIGGMGDAATISADAMRSTIETAKALLKNTYADLAETRRWFAENGARKAEITETRLVIADEVQALALQMIELKAQIDEEVTSQITALQQTVSTLAETTAQDITSLESRMGSAESGVSANAGAISGLTTTVTNQGGLITANSQSIAQMTVTINGFETSITDITNVTNDINGNLSAYRTLRIKANVNGVDYVAGTTTGIQNTDTGVRSYVNFLADQFAMLINVNGTPTPIFTNVGTQVILRSAVIGDATITSAKIANGAIGRLQIADSIQSNNYAQGSTGMKLDFANGTLELNGNEPGQGRKTIGNIRDVVYNENNQVVVVIGKRL
uniref:Tail protein n=1 Tax=Pectobacterium phage Taid TaxID=3158139 RepID=A0AB39AC03_9CAUD